MPVIKRFGSFVVQVFFADHNPPHVHVVGSDFEATVAIKDSTILRGSLPAQVEREALAWIADNRALLMEKWDQGK